MIRELWLRCWRLAARRPRSRKLGFDGTGQFLQEGTSLSISYFADGLAWCASIAEMRLGDLDGHLEVDGEGDFLRSTEGGGAEAGGAADDGADGRAFSATEECAHQGSSARAEAGAD